jgi:outer membrane lipoprotein-sorting protein
MKRKILLGLLVSIPVIFIILIIIFRLTAEPSNEEIIESLRNIKNYTTKVEYTIKNSRGEETEETTQYYSIELGGRIDFGEDRTKIYKEDKIFVKDYISNKEYEIEKDMDNFHYLALMNQLLSSPIMDDIKEGQEEWGDTEYLEFNCELFLQNEHLDKIKVFIDKNNEVPIGAIIYDKEGNDRVKIIYKNFEKLKEIDKGLFY